jgi:hypothetical protein
MGYFAGKKKTSSDLTAFRGFSKMETFLMDFGVSTNAPVFTTEGAAIQIIYTSEPNLRICGMP